MTDEFPVDDPRLSEAVSWFNRRRTEALSPQDALTFADWLADDQNEAMYEEVERAWALTGNLHGDLLLKAAKRRDPRRSPWHRSAATISLMAASLAFFMVVAWLFSERGFVPDLRSTFSPTQEYRTAVGQISSYALADGSTIQLDTDTVLRVRMSGRERRVLLDRGRASFEVATDAERPFIVAAEGRTVQAIGTTFDVSVASDRMVVTLIEGRVRVSDKRGGGAAAVDMQPSWRLSIDGNERWRRERVDIDQVTSWHHGMLSFYEDPLIEAVAEMNRYSRRKIVFAGPPPEVSVMGVFEAGDIESLARAMEMNKLVRVTARDNERIELSAR